MRRRPSCSRRRPSPSARSTRTRGRARSGRSGTRRPAPAGGRRGRRSRGASSRCWSSPRGRARWRSRRLRRSLLPAARPQRLTAVARAVERGAPRQRRRHLGDVPALLGRPRQPDGDEAALDGLEAPAHLPEVDRMAAAGRHPRVVDQLQPGGRPQPEHHTVVVNPPASGFRSVSSADALGEELAPLRERGGCSEPVPPHVRVQLPHGCTLRAGRRDRPRPGVVVRETIRVVLDLRVSERRGGQSKSA